MRLRYFQKRKRCGKTKCRTCQESGGHGPYWYASQTVKGRTVETYIGQRLPFESQQAIGRTEQSRLVGRNNELAHLMQLLETIEEIRHLKRSTRQILPTTTHTVILTGEMGIGKTRLAEEVAREAVLRNWSVIWVSTGQENSAPYRLWSEMLRATLAQGLWKRLGVSRQPERYRPLRFLLPDVLDLWTEEPRPPEPLHLWESIRVLLSTISEKTTVLLVLDDLHRADSESCELLAYLARYMRGIRIMFLCTCCESELPSDHPLNSSLTHLQREQMAELLPIAPLSNEQIQELISYVPIDLAKRIASHISGNPLFAEELAHSSLAGDLADVFNAPRPRELPVTVSTVLALRLAHVSTECQRLLECGTVLGESFTFVAVCAMGSETMHLEEDSLIDLLEEAMQAGTITEEGNGDTIFYHFWHPLLRTYLYNHLSAARRASLHRRAANTLQNLAAGRKAEYAAQIAHHLIQGGATPDQIAHFVELAADYAYSLSAYPNAEKWYRQALEYGRKLAGVDLQEERLRYISLLERLGECTRAQGKYEEAYHWYEEALTNGGKQLTFTENLSQTRQALLWIEIGSTWYSRGKMDQAQHAYQTSEKMLHDGNIHIESIWSYLRYRQSYAYWRCGIYDKALTLASEALRLHLTQHLQALEDSDSSSALVKRILTGDLAHRGRLYQLLGLITNGMGHSQETIEHWNAARNIFEKYSSKRDLAVLCCNLGDVHLRKAEYLVAQTILHQALTLAEEIGEIPLAGVIMGNLGVASLRQKMLLEAEMWLEKGVRYAEQANNAIHCSLLHSYLAHVFLEQGQLKKAGASVRAALSIRTMHILPGQGIALVALAALRIAQAQSGSSYHFLNCAERTLERVLRLQDIESETLTEARLLLAQVNLLSGKEEQAQALIIQAQDEATSYDLNWLVARAQAMLATSLPIQQQ